MKYYHKNTVRIARRQWFSLSSHCRIYIIISSHKKNQGMYDYGLIADCALFLCDINNNTAIYYLLHRH